MKNYQKILYFFVLPILAVLLYPPQSLIKGIGVVIAAVLLFALIGYFLLKGKELALTFMIFVQGMNVIIRLMMFFSTGFTNQGQPNVLFLITCFLGLVLSFWLLVRLDRQDIRLSMAG